ncbi:hypothetical protein JCM12825_21070 [Desulfurobacterium crinifex]
MISYEELVELYTDYLIVVNGQATATGLSAILDTDYAPYFHKYLKYKVLRMEWIERTVGSIS